MKLGGIILCGGESRRMGQSKAWLELEGEPLLSRVYRRVAAVAGRVVVVSAPGQSLPELPPAANLAIDDVPGSGPLGGLATGHAALAQTQGYVFVCGCDYPFLTGPLLRQLLEAGAGEEAITFTGDRLQPLCAWYRASALGEAGKLFSQGERRLTRFLETLCVARVDGSTLDAYAPGVSTMNVNSPDDYARARRIAAKD